MSHGNLLIAMLNRPDRQRLIAVGDNVCLEPGELIAERGQDAESVFFPMSGVVVLTVPSYPSGGLGILLVGREGMLGIHRVLGDCIWQMRAVAQTSGKALRIEASEFGRALCESPTLRCAMLGYVGCVLNQIAVAAACSRFHSIGPRLSGWLLMYRDRVGSENFHVTQEALGRMLGIRRVGITLAARELQRQHLIDYHHGALKILDVAGLRAVAGSSYYARPAFSTVVQRAGQSIAIGSAAASQG